MYLQRRDRWLHSALRLAALCVGGLLIPVIWVTVAGAWASLPGFLQSLTTVGWHPGSDEFGLLAMLAASLLVSAVALLLAAPGGVFLGLWLTLFAAAVLKRPLLALMELLAGIPSVVYGLWGLIALVPLINNWAAPGASALAACLVLAMMILPFAILTTAAALEQVPASQVRACRAMGLSHWGSFLNVYWPYARVSIARGIVLQFGRALGETMAVLMVAGNIVQLPGSLFDPVRTLTANIALEMGYASGVHSSALFLSGLLLLILSSLLMALFQPGKPA